MPDGLLEIDRHAGAIVSTPLAPDASWPTPVVGCAARSGASALVGCVRHDAMVWVPANGSGSRRCVIGERIAHSEQLRIVALEGGFLVIHENGLVRIDEHGTELWRVDRVTVDWQLVGERDGAVWLSDHDGNLLGFDAGTGFERS